VTLLEVRDARGGAEFRHGSGSQKLLREIAITRAGRSGSAGGTPGMTVCEFLWSWTSGVVAPIIKIVRVPTESPVCSVCMGRD